MRAAQRSDSSVVVSLAFRASSVRLVRARITSDPALRRLRPEVLEDVRTVLSELVANAVRHADPLPSGRLLVTWHVDDDAVVVSVSDGGSPSAPRVAHSPEESLGGRGLAIVEALSRRWWVRREEDSLTVTAEIARS